MDIYKENVVKMLHSLPVNKLPFDDLSSETFTYRLYIMIIAGRDVFKC